MKHLVFSTADVSAREQFAFWRDGFAEAVLGVGGEPLAATDRGFRARAEAWIAPSLQRFAYSVDNELVSRGPHEIERRPWDSFWIYHERGPGVWFEHGGREFVTATGDLIIGDSNPAFATRARRDYRHDIWRLPRALVAPHLPALEGPLWMPLQVRAGTAALLLAYLDSLGQEMTVLPPVQLAAVAENLSRLLAIICGAPPAAHRETMQSAVLQRAKQHIARHLADSGLTPGSTAAALGVSERTMQVAFAPSGESFAQFVMRSRLRECRAGLTNPVAPDRSVADIAFGWGFQSLPTFYRAFRQQYGIAPGEMREAARHAGSKQPPNGWTDLAG